MNKYLSLAQRSHVTKERHEWRLAYSAFRFPNHAELADLLMVNRSTPHRWASAYEMFLYIGEGCSMQRARALRRSKLTRGHFSRLNVLRRKYEFSPQQAKEYLEDALHAEMKSEQMAAVVEELELGRGGELLKDWIRFTSSWRGFLDRLKIPHGFPPKFAERAEELSAAVKTFTHEIDEERKRL